MAAAKQNWSSAESLFLLRILNELNIINRLDGRKTRNTELFKQVHEKMKEAGQDRSIEQIRNRWKTLKTAYYKAKAHNNKSGYNPSNFPFYNEMDELMGGRPLSNVAEHGVDVGFDDVDVDVDADEANVANVSMSDDDSSPEGTDNILEVAEESHQTPTEPQTSRRRSAKNSSGYAKAMHTWSMEQQTFWQNMQQTQNTWMEEQQEKRLEKEERLLSKFVEENSRANERLVGQLFEGLRAIFPQTPPPQPGVAPVHSYPPQHPYSGYSGPAHFPHNNPNYENFNSDYHFHDLD